MRSPASLLQQLVRIPSVNPRDRDEPAESAIADYVTRWSADAGLEVELQPVLPGRPNVLVRLPGRDRSRTLLLEAHLDTVEVEGMTVEPFGGEIRDGRLYGRGACDTKASLAAMLTAIAELKRSGSSPIDVLLAATMDEEYGYRGVSAVIGRGERFAAAIVGEPTDLDLVTAHKGSARFRVTTRGRACHSSMPWAGDNAILRMADVLQFVRREIEPEAAARTHPRVGPATFCVSLISGGIAVNTVPATCTITVDRRTLPGEEPRAVWEEYRRRLEALAPGQITVHEPMLDFAMDTDPAEPIVQTLAAAVRGTGRPAEIRGVNYGTDASKLARAGVPAVVFGPGSIAEAHSAGEYVELSQVESAAAILIETIRTF
jgi:acetylornithine deacetylase